jgi:hypothetical protein
MTDVAFTLPIVHTTWFTYIQFTALTRLLTVKDDSKWTTTSYTHVFVKFHIFWQNGSFVVFFFNIFLYFI